MNTHRFYAWGLRAFAAALLLSGAAFVGCSSGTVDATGKVRQPLVSPNGTITASAGEGRSGWYPNQPLLSPSIVGGPTFGRLFKAALTITPGEQVFAQPLAIDDSVLIVTEANNAYVLDAETGAIRASRALHQPFASTDTGCADITPTIGITGTPVIDYAARTAYFFAKTYRAMRTGVLENDTVWYAHAVDVDTLTERPNFPVEIAGHATNDPTITFTPNIQMQRPGVLLMNGVVYAGFGAHCDVGPYNGYVVGVTTDGHLKTMFATEAGPQKDHGSGIWQSGGGLLSDGPGRIFFMTGNGYSNTYGNPVPSNLPPQTLEESAVRVDVQADGSLKAMDFFAAYDGAYLDGADADFGSGGPVALPDELGTQAHPHLMLAGGKEAVLYLLDREQMGGFKQGTGQGDAVVSRINIPAGMWSYPAVWSGEGGWAYIDVNGGPFQALQYSLRADGVPAFAAVGRTTDSFGFGSGSPVITSDGTSPGTGLVWVTYTSQA